MTVLATIMIVLGIAIALAGLAIAGWAALPTTMSIDGRATQMAAGSFLMFLGLAIILEAAATPQTQRGSGTCLVVMGLALAVFVRWAMAWRLRENVRDWETKYKHMWPKGPVADFFKHTLNADSPDAAKVIEEIHTTAGQKKVRIQRTIVSLLSAIVCFGLAALMFVLHQTTLPPNPNDLETVTSRVIYVEEVRDKSGRSTTYYLDITLEAQARQLRYYDGQYRRRKQILAALEEDGIVEMRVLKPAARKGLRNDVWQIRKGDSVLVSYDELVAESRGGQVFFFIFLVVSPSTVGLWLLYKTWHYATNRG